MDKLPSVSILTPLTHDRLKFLDMMISNILTQDYPHDLIEWVVVGDTVEETKTIFENIFKKMGVIKCKFFPCDIMKDIGKKRNECVKHASHKILANMDSDDIYHKTFLSYSINELRNRKCGIVGCRDLMILFPKLEKMIYIQGSSLHEGTSVFKRNHWKSFKYREGVKFAEGHDIARGGNVYNELDIRKMMICISHDTNTFSKSRFSDYPEVEIPKDNLKKLLDMIPSNI